MFFSVGISPLYLGVFSDFFNWISDFFTDIWHFVVNLFNAIPSLFTFGRSFYSLMLAPASYFPPVFSYIVIFTLSIGILSIIKRFV